MSSAMSMARYQAGGAVGGGTERFADSRLVTKLVNGKSPRETRRSCPSLSQLLLSLFEGLGVAFVSVGDMVRLGRVDPF